MMNDRWTDRLSDYLDGELPDGERIALEAHLQSCAECSAILADLRRVVHRARAWREDQSPPGDLWPGIASRIGALPTASPAIVDLTSRRLKARRWTFSLPQLAAAGLALMTLSGGAVWLVSSRSQPEAGPTSAAVATSAPTVPVAMRPNASQSYAAAVADLERVLAQGRGKLDSTTINVIEQNLAAIDRAIADAQRALEADSANLYLNTHLAETMRRKLDLLRQAAALVPVS
jgi:anti-sigma factor RsiW